MNWHKLLLLRPVLVLMGAAAGFLAMSSLPWAQTASKKRETAANAQILPLLPRKEGEFACYRVTLDGLAMDFEDWSKARMVKLERLDPRGEPYWRNEPAVLKDQKVRAFTLALHYDTRQADYDWIYNFHLLAEVDGLGKMVAVGECPYYTGNKSDPHTKERYAPNTTWLGCGIDCDGGSFGLERIAGSTAMNLQFSAISALRMKRGCGGGGSFGMRAQKTETSVRIEKADAMDCREVNKAAAN